MKERQRRLGIIGKAEKLKKALFDLENTSRRQCFHFLLSFSAEMAALQVTREWRNRISKAVVSKPPPEQTQAKTWRS